MCKWGANVSIDPVITRVDPSISRNTQVLVCIASGSEGIWHLPGGIIVPKEPDFVDCEDVKLPPQRQLPDLLATVFLHNLPRRDASDFDACNPSESTPLTYLESIARLGLRQTEAASAFDRISRSFAALVSESSRIVYKGYCDDPRNTDDAWVETAVHHCHLPDQISERLSITSDVSHWKPTGAEVGLDFQWMDIGCTAQTNLRASHYDFVELCVPFCKCGRRRYDRSDNSHQVKEGGAKAGEAVNGIWRPKEMQGRTDAGNIQFIGKATSSHFVRARMETEGDVSHVRLMLHSWGMRQPNAVISLTGGAQGFEMESDVAETIFQGVLRAASVTKACIVDGGTDTGVMKLMGMAVARDGHRVDLIGVANWGTVISRECMLEDRGQLGEGGERRKKKPSLQPSYRRKTSVMLQLENLIDDYRSHTKRNCYLKTQPNSTSGAGLDPNHRFFVLVDDGTVGKFGSEIDARGKLEYVLRNPTRFQKFVDMWEIAQTISDLETSRIEFLDKICEMPPIEIINFRNYLNLYHANNLNMLSALHFLEKELESRLDQASISRSDRECIESSIKVWRHLQAVLAGQNLEDIFADLSNFRLWTPDDLLIYQKFIQYSSNHYKSNQHFQKLLRYFDSIPEHAATTAINRVRRYSPCSDVLGAWGGKDAEFLSPTSSSTRQNNFSEADDELFQVSKVSQKLVTSNSCVLVQEDIEEQPDVKSGNMSPTMKRFSKITVPLCFRCEGAHRNRITFKKWRNSIPRKDYDKWIGVQMSMKHKATRLDMIVRCKGCSSKLTSREIEDESFYPCPGCDHYFFRSRVLRLRSKGHPHIKCDHCSFRRKIDDILGKFIPAVMVVVQGGPGTIKTVVSSNTTQIQKGSITSIEFDTLEQSLKICTPIVIVEGTGKAADFIAFTWRHIHEGGRMCFGCPRSSCVGFVRRFHPKSMELLPASCPLVQQEYERLFWDREAEFIEERDWDHKDDAAKKEQDKKRKLDRNKHVSWVIELCRRKETVTLCNVMSGDDIDYAIMRAMCKGTMQDGRTLSTVEQLQLAIEWDLHEDNLNAVKLARREILSDDSWDMGEIASDLRESLTSAMVYALRRNSWRFVELLDHAGAMLPNREVLLKSLYPREVDQFSNETVIPSRLRLIMNLPEVKRNAAQRLFANYQRGVLSDEDKGPLEYDCVCIENSIAWQNVVEHVMNLPDALGHFFHILHESNSDGKPLVQVARSYGELHTIRNKEVSPFRETAVLVANFEEFEKVLDKQFDREIFGTKAHVEAVMHHLGFTKSDGQFLDQYDYSNEQAYSELFVWSIMMGRTQLAMLFWRRCQASSFAHGISRALFASAVAHRIAEIAGGQASKLLVGDRSADQLGLECTPSLASTFEMLAKRLMRKGFELDQQSVVDAILLRWTDTPDCWLDNRGRSAEYLSPLLLAGYAQAESFVDDPAFQSCLDFIWYGGLILDEEQCQTKFEDEDYILLPFSASHIGELGWRQILFISIATGAAAIPINLFLSFLLQWEIFMIATLVSYLFLPLSMVFLSAFYFKGREYGTLGRVSFMQRVFRRVSGEKASSLVQRFCRTCTIFYTAPIVKFSGRSVHFILFVFLYTYVGITMMQDTYTDRELFMHIWFAMLLLSEIRQWAESGWERYSESIWNALDLIIFFLYSMAAFARAAELLNVTFLDNEGHAVFLRDLGGYNETSDSHGPLGHAVAAKYEYQFQDLIQARGLHGLVGVLLWIRLLDILRVDQYLGPLVLVLTSMVNDVLRFAWVRTFVICLLNMKILSYKQD